MSTTAMRLQQDMSYTVTERILAAIAEREGVDPLDLDRRLYDVIDSDALEALFQSDGMKGQVTFTYHGYKVTVHSDGEIKLNPIDE